MRESGCVGVLGVCVRERVSVRESECVCVRERVSVRESECVCV